MRRRIGELEEFAWLGGLRWSYAQGSTRLVIGINIFALAANSGTSWTAIPAEAGQ